MRLNCQLIKHDQCHRISKITNFGPILNKQLEVTSCQPKIPILGLGDIINFESQPFHGNKKSSKKFCQLNLFQKRSYFVVVLEKAGSPDEESKSTVNANCTAQSS